MGFVCSHQNFIIILYLKLWLANFILKLKSTMKNNSKYYNLLINSNIKKIIAYLLKTDYDCFIQYIKLY